MWKKELFAERWVEADEQRLLFLQYYLVSEVRTGSENLYGIEVDMHNRIDNCMDGVGIFSGYISRSRQKAEEFLKMAAGGEATPANMPYIIDDFHDLL